MHLQWLFTGNYLLIKKELWYSYITPNNVLKLEFNFVELKIITFFIYTNDAGFVNIFYSTLLS